MKTIYTVLRINIKSSLIILFVLVSGLTSCSKDDGPARQKEIIKSSEKKINSFVFLLTNNPIDINVVATIDEENKTITATMPIGTDVTGLLPEIKISNNATVNPSSAQDFTESMEYLVTAEDESIAIYTITIIAQRTQRQILQEILDTNPNNTLEWNLDNTTDLGLLPGVTLNTTGKIIGLEMNFMNIAELPSEIGQLNNLSDLSLFANQISSLPVEIVQLVNLENLNLGANLLTSLPSKIEQLVNLERLGLQGNQLASLPTKIGQLINLMDLDLTNNQQLTSIPSEIGQLTNLERLGLNSNQLTSIPSEIGQLTNLRILPLSGNQLTSIPSEIGQLVNLELLQLSNNQLTSLPPEIGQLTNLTTLSLWNNQLTSLPPELGFLTKLEKLEISGNNLTTIPQAICNLKNFRPIDPFPLIIFMDDDVTCSTTSQKDALISIYTYNPSNTLLWGVDNYPGVNFNENGNPIAITANNKNLTRLPIEIGEFTALESLNVNNNNLKSLPNTLGNLNSLSVITAGSNEFNTVPSELGQLTNLALLSLTNNPLESIPQEVCDLQTSNGGILTLLTDPGEGCN